MTDAIKDWIQSVSAIPVDGKEGPADVCVIELGGTVGKSRKRIKFCFPKKTLFIIHYNFPFPG